MDEKEFSRILKTVYVPFAQRRLEIYRYHLQNNNLTLQRVGEHFGITKQRVSEIIKRVEKELSNSR